MNTIKLFLLIFILFNSCKLFSNDSLIYNKSVGELVEYICEQKRIFIDTQSGTAILINKINKLCAKLSICKMVSISNGKYILKDNKDLFLQNSIMFSNLINFSDNYIFYEEIENQEILITKAFLIFKFNDELKTKVNSSILDSFINKYNIFRDSFFNDKIEFEIEIPFSKFITSPFAGYIVGIYHNIDFTSNVTLFNGLYYFTITNIENCQLNIGQFIISNEGLGLKTNSTKYFLEGLNLKMNE